MTGPYLFGKPHGEILDERFEAVNDRGRQAIFRLIFRLEGAIRHREFHSSPEAFAKTASELLSWYAAVEEDGPPEEIREILEETTRYRRLIEGDQISWRAIRVMRYEPGMSDLEVVEAVRKCRKEGKQHENPGAKIKCLDPRFARLS